MITYLYGLVSIVKELNIMGFGKISRTFWSNTQVRASHCHECKWLKMAIPWAVASLLSWRHPMPTPMNIKSHTFQRSHLCLRSLWLASVQNSTSMKQRQMQAFRRGFGTFQVLQMLVARMVCHFAIKYDLECILLSHYFQVKTRDLFLFWQKIWVPLISPWNRESWLLVDDDLSLSLCLARLRISFTLFRKESKTTWYSQGLGGINYFWGFEIPAWQERRTS